MEPDRVEIFRAVAALAAEHGNGELKQVREDTHFVNDLGFDSLTSVELVMAIEDQFQIRVPDTDVPQLQTIGQVVDYVMEHRT